MNRIPRIWSLLKRMPWAILPEKLDEIVALLRAKANGEDIAAYAAKTKPEPTFGNSIAVLPIFGTLTHRAGLISDFSGATSMDRFSKYFHQAMEDPAIGSIVLDIDSPGGAVYGIPEMADKIRAARGDKKIVAIANAQAASAAYWLASAAGEIVVTPSGEVGSIGVYAVHDDFSVALEKAGIKTTYISAGKYKTEGNPDEPLSVEARDYIQTEVDRYYDMFIRAVAVGRGVALKTVREGFGEGRMVGAEKAVDMGMADRVASFDETIARLAGKKTTKTVSAEVIAEIPIAAGLSDEDRQRRARILELS